MYIEFRYGLARSQILQPDSCLADFQLVLSRFRTCIPTNLRPSLLVLSLRAFLFLQSPSLATMWLIVSYFTNT